MTQNEYAFQDNIKCLLESQQIEVYTEVIPEECKNWENPYKVDLIFYYWGEYYGFELKHIRTHGQGGVIGKAFLQLQKYKDLRYFGDKKIKQWGIGVKIGDDNSTLETHTSDIFIQTFFNYLEFNYLRYKDYSYNRKMIVLNPNTKDRLEIKNFKWDNDEHKYQYY